MRGTPIREVGRRCLTTALFITGAVGFASCATEKPRAALLDDPDSQHESTIPWNKPQGWEGRANFPGGMGGNPAETGPGSGYGNPGGGY